MSKKLKFLVLMLIGILLNVHYVYGTLTSPSSCTFSAAGGKTTLPDDNTDVTWTASTTPSGFESSSDKRGLQWSGATVNATGGLTLTCTSFNGNTISKIEVVWSRNNSNGATVSAKVNGIAFGTADQNEASTKNRKATFSGSATASTNITINATSKSSSNSFYIKSITVTFSSGSTKTLLYDANGANGGTVPTDANAYNVDDAATVKTNSGSLWKVGHSFDGWNLAADGSGKTYTNPDTFKIRSSGNTLYAKWTNTYAGDEFTLVEVLSEISNGSKIIILDADHATALSTEQGSNNRTSVAVTASPAANTEFAMSNSNKTVTLGSATKVQVITLENLATPVSNTYQFNVENGYLYAAGNGSGNNYLRTQTTNDANGHWLIGLSEGTFSVTAQGTNGNNTLKKNTSYAFFSGYASGQKNVLIYVKDEGTKYSITWANGGHGTAPTSPTSASKVTLPELTADGWQHLGWTANQAVTNVSTSTSISSGTLIANGTRVQLGANTTFTAQWKQVCATPSFNNGTGTYNNNVSVTLTSTPPTGATIYYELTEDGSDPSTPTSSSTEYTGAISVTKNGTKIKAIAIKSGCVDSEVASATYTLTCGTPSFSPVAGTYTVAKDVEISTTTTSATIYYTTDGSTPNTSSAVYSSAIHVDDNMTIKALVVKDNYNNASVSASYTMNIPYTVTFSTGATNPTVDAVTEETKGDGITLPDGVTPTATGWEFVGWATASCSESTKAPVLYAAGTEDYKPGANTTMYAVYRKYTSGTSSVTFDAADISNLTEHPLYTRDWIDNTAGIDMYISAGQRYTGSPNAWNVTKSTSPSTWNFALITAYRKIKQIDVEITGTDYKIDNSSGGVLSDNDDYENEKYAMSASSPTSVSPYTQTITYTGDVSGDVTQVWMYATTSQQIRAKTIEVTYYNARFNSNPCDYEITIGTPSITGEGSVTFTHGGSALAAGDIVETCSGSQDVVATVTPSSGYECTALSFSGGSVSVDPTPGAGNYPAYSSTQDYTLTFGENTTAATLSTTATFSAKSVTSWTWTYGGEAIPNPVNLYVDEKARFDVTYEPSDIIDAKKTYTRGKVDKYMNWFGGALQPTYFQCQGKESTGESTTAIVLTHADGPTTTINIKVKPKPTVTFVDIVQNKNDFANSGDGWTAGTGVLSSTASSGVISHTKKTPTHADVSAPVGGNSCETSHLHLIGWIRSDCPVVEAYMNGMGAKPGNTAITTEAGDDDLDRAYFLAPNADINVEDYNGKTFYAVWATIE